MNVFYSWQSDTEQSTGHYLIRDALQDAINELHEELSLEEADRSKLEHDTKGLTGAPAIAEAILAKIDACDVFAADVTVVGAVTATEKTDEEDAKALINSNVAIELGYALKSRGADTFLLVMNTAYGGPEKLPFDLQHRRWPILFDLPSDAGRSEIKKARKDLVSSLKPALRTFIDAGTKPREEALFEALPATVSPAHYFDPNELLVPEDVMRGWPGSRCVETALLYVRMYPKVAVERWSVSETSDLLSNSDVGPMRRGIGNGWSPTRNRFGGIVYSSYGEERNILSCTQVFRTREVWGFEVETLMHTGEYNRKIVQVIPARQYEEVFSDAIKRYLNFAKSSLAYSLPVIVEAGASNVKGFYMEMAPKYVERLWGPINHDHIQKRCELVGWDKKDVDQLLLEIFEEFFDAVGERRPAGLNGFPTDASAAK